MVFSFRAESEEDLHRKDAAGLRLRTRQLKSKRVKQSMEGADGAVPVTHWNGTIKSGTRSATRFSRGERLRDLNGGGGVLRVTRTRARTEERRRRLMAI